MFNFHRNNFYTYELLSTVAINFKTIFLFSELFLIYYYYFFFIQDSENEPKPNATGLGGFKGRRRVFEAPKPQNYYHLEYKLFPDDNDVIKTDVVTYGVAAKIYTDTDSKVMKTWRNADKTWVAWTHR